MQKRWILKGWSFLIRDQRGSFILEAAVIVPLIISLISAALILTVNKYGQASEMIQEVGENFSKDERNPRAVINNTDLVMEVIERIKT